MRTSTQTIILLLVFLTSPLSLLAQQVKRDAALQKAQSFLIQNVNGHQSVRKAPRHAPKLVLANESDELYIFNDEANGGYVIVSGDERMPDVLGYSYDGHYVEENMPENLRSLLDMYAGQIAYLQSHPEAQVMAADTKQREPIAPLIECAWGQDEPFNNMCPTIGGEKAPTGCVATAIAQLMYYWKWPKQTTQTIPEYTTSTKKIKVPAIPVTMIDWDSMLPDYSNGNYTQQQADAVATLMKLCGAAVKMDYKTGGSSASLFGPELCKYFDCDDQYEVLHRWALNLSNEEWNQIIYDELAVGQPIFYNGTAVDGKESYTSHAFVVDGYDKDGYFHINLGWGPGSGAYCLLTDIIRGYNEGQSCIIGIRPANSEEAKAYAILNNGTLTLYYDKDMKNRQGTLLFPIRADKDNGKTPWSQDGKNIQKAIFDPSFADARLSGLELLFCGCENLKAIEGIKILNTSGTNSMYCMFSGCTSLKEIDLSHFDTRNVTDMTSMFGGCSSLTDIDLSHFNTGNVTSMHGMFADCSSLSSLDLSSLNLQSLKDMDYMLSGCTSLTHVRLDSIITEVVENMAGVFAGCSSLLSLDLSGLRTDNVTTMERMFDGCSSLATLNLNSFNTEHVTNMGEMFSNCSSLTELDLSSFHTENVTDMYKMFSECQALETIYAGDSWSKEKAKGMEMFYFCLKLVGGKGTCYTDYYETSEKFAHIDGGPDNPGYFTYKAPQYYTLTYMVDGEVYKTYELEPGTAIMPETAPTKEGFDFSGWSEIPEMMPAYDVVINGSFTTDIRSIIIVNNVNQIYDQQGNRINHLRKGVNIIRMKDGWVKKVVIK